MEKHNKDTRELTWDEFQRETYKLLRASKLQRASKLIQEAKDYPDDKELIDEEIADIANEIEFTEDELSESEDDSDSDDGGDEIETQRSTDRFSGKKVKI